MKKILAIMLALAMICGLAACGSPKETTAAPTEAPKTTEAPATTAAPTEAPTTEPAPTEPELKVMSYAEFMAADAETNEPVLIEAYVQAKQEYYASKSTANLYLADDDGGYYCYGCTMTQEQYDKLKVGVKVRVSGEKAVWEGLAEISNATLEAIDENDLFEDAFMDVTDIMGDTEALAEVMNRMVSFTKLVIIAQNDGEAIGRKESDSDPDLYFRAGNELGYVDFCVESYLTGKDSDTYKAAEALKVGDVVNVEGFLYWYRTPNPHVTGIEVVGNVNDKSEGVMSYEEFLAADPETMEEVVIEAYVQGKQAYNPNKEQASLYLADADGGYFCYGVSMKAEEYDKLEIGTKVRISGERAAWHDLDEVNNGKLEAIEEDGFVYAAQPVDLSKVFGSADAMYDYMNLKFAANGVVIVAQDDGSAVSAKPNDVDPDLYFRAEGPMGVVDFVVESALTDPDTKVYETADGLKVGDMVNLEGFLYWDSSYGGPNPHLTAIEVVGNVNEKSEGVMTYAEFMAADASSAEPVVIEAYVQGKQAYYEAKEAAVLYLADADGAYFGYRVLMTKDEYEKLEEGTKVRISGEKAEWRGEIEVAEGGKLEEILEGKYIAAPVAVNGYDHDAEALAKYMNRKVVFKGMAVEPSDGVAVSKNESDSDPDLYFKAGSADGLVNFVVESYLTGPDTDAYKAAEALEVGDKVDVVCFLYWDNNYGGPNPHVIDIVKAD